MTHGTPLNTVTLPPPGTDNLLATQATLLTEQGAETSMNRSGTSSVDILSTQSHQTVTNTLTWNMDADVCMSFIIGYGFLLPFASPLRQWGNLQTSQVPVECFCTCHGSQTPRSLSSPHQCGSRVLPSVTDTTSALRTQEFRGSIARPAHAAADASPDPSREPAHGSR